MWGGEGDSLERNFDRGDSLGDILLEPFQRHKIFNHLVLTVLLLTNGSGIYLFKVNNRNITTMCSKSVQNE